jgi:outer membrane receptor for Fe3+-dicitrate
VIVTGYNLEPGVPVVPLEAIGSREVFGPTQVRETGAREINDLVQYIPAISTRPYNGGEASAPSFSMRGLPDDGLTEYINVLIDGVPASSMPYGWTAFSFLPVTPDRLFAVDYLRGAHSWRVRYARWGWSATLGGTYVGESFSDEANTTAPSADGRLGINPDRVTWDARLAKLVTLGANANLELAVGASNLFDEDWYVHSRGRFFGPGLAAGPPRQIYGSVGLNMAF